MKIRQITGIDETTAQRVSNAEPGCLVLDEENGTGHFLFMVPARHGRISAMDFVEVAIQAKIPTVRVGSEAVLAYRVTSNIQLPNSFQRRVKQDVELGAWGEAVRVAKLWVEALMGTFHQVAAFMENGLETAIDDMDCIESFTPEGQMVRVNCAIHCTRLGVMLDFSVLSRPEEAPHVLAAWKAEHACLTM